MKVLAFAVLLIGSASALGSGPYLPSGWRPQGPAFLLPSEVEEPEPAVPLKDVPVQDVEASGSAFLREYGPPKVVSQDITIQALPDVATERSFAFIQAKFADEADTATEEVSEIETATEAEISQENIVETEAIIQGKSVSQTRTEESQRSLQGTEELQESAEEVTEDNNEVTKETIQVTQENNEVTSESTVTQETSEVKETEEVKGISETLVLENETVQDVSAKNIQETIGAIRPPQGFLEYGPPGFKEYGPPKEDLLRSENILESSADATETNETRRRRFSPKFKRTLRRKAH